MNLRHLSFVLKVAELGSFSAAAKACNVTQPTLSAGVTQIETQLGGRLFERSTRTVALTPFCRDLLPATQDVIASKKALEIQAEILLKPRSKLVRVGISPIVEISKVVDLMKPYRDRHPEVEFIYKECFLDDLEDRLATDKIDLVIWPDRVVDKQALESVSLYCDPWVFLPNAVLVGSLKHSPCPISEIADQSLILTSGYCGLSQATQSMFEQMKLKLNLYPGRAISYNAIEEWADLGLGAALLPASKVSRGRKGPVIPVLKEDQSAAMLNIVVSWRHSTTTSPYLENLVSFIQKLVPSGVPS